MISRFSGFFFSLDPLYVFFLLFFIFLFLLGAVYFAFMKTKITGS